MPTLQGTVFYIVLEIILLSGTALCSKLVCWGEVVLLSEFGSVVQGSCIHLSELCPIPSLGCLKGF